MEGHWLWGRQRLPATYPPFLLLQLGPWTAPPKPRRLPSNQGPHARSFRSTVSKQKGSIDQPRPWHRRQPRAGLRNPAARSGPAGRASLVALARVCGRSRRCCCSQPKLPARGGRHTAEQLLLGPLARDVPRPPAVATRRFLLGFDRSEGKARAFVRDGDGQNIRAPAPETRSTHSGEIDRRSGPDFSQTKAPTRSRGRT